MMYSVLVVSPDSKMQTRIGKYVPNVNHDIVLSFADSDRGAVGAIMGGNVDAIIYEHTPQTDAFNFYDQMMRHAGSAMPFIVISPEKDADLAIAAMDARMDYYLPETFPNFFMELASRVVMSVERARSEVSRCVDTDRSSALMDLISMKDRPMEDVLKYALDEVVKLTKSSIGYIALYNSRTRQLKMISWSFSAMDQCSMTARPIYYDLDKTGVWGEPIRLMRSITINDYEHDTEHMKRGTPSGHVVLSRLLMVPVIKHGIPMATVGVGNKSSDYTPQDEEQLRLFIYGLFSIYDENIFREDRDENESRVSDLINYIPMGIAMLNRDKRFVHANYAARSYLGLTENLILNKDMNSLEGGASETIRKSLELSSETGQPKMSYFKYSSEEGVLDIYSYVVPIFKDGEINGWMLAMNDMSTIYRTSEGFRPVRDRMRSILSYAGHILASVQDNIDFVKSRAESVEVCSKLNSAHYGVDEILKYLRMETAIGSALPSWVGLSTCINVEIPDGLLVSSWAEDVKILADSSFIILFDLLYRYSRKLGATEVTIGSENAVDGSYIIKYCDNSRGVAPRVKELADSGYSSGFSYILVKDIVDACGFRLEESGTKGRGLEISIVVMPDCVSR